MILFKFFRRNSLQTLSVLTQSTSLGSTPGRGIGCKSGVIVGAFAPWLLEVHFSAGGTKTKTPIFTHFCRTVSAFLFQVQKQEVDLINFRVAFGTCCQVHCPPSSPTPIISRRGSRHQAKREPHPFAASRRKSQSRTVPNIRSAILYKIALCDDGCRLVRCNFFSSCLLALLTTDTHTLRNCPLRAVIYTSAV